MLSLLEKKSIKNRAKQDLRQKLAFEKTFQRELRSLFSQTVRDFKTSYAQGVGVISAKDQQSEWVALLKRHYSRVQKGFLGQTKSVFAFFSHKQNENELIDDPELLSLALLEYRKRRSIEQANIIAETNERQMQEAVQEAQSLLLEQGEPTDNRSVAAMAAVLLTRKLKLRIETIATYETQSVAENTKFTSAQVATGRVPASVPRTFQQIVRPRRELKATKAWSTMGDNKVRQSHRVLNGQREEMDAPFQSGSNMAMYPGDTSLGASLAFVVGCRCSAIYFF